jgi:hypothetical protein
MRKISQLGLFLIFASIGLGLMGCASETPKSDAPGSVAKDEGATAEDANAAQPNRGEIERESKGDSGE